MDVKSERLQAIADGINAANKIHNIYKSGLLSDSRTVIRDGRLAMINDILQVIAGNSPERSANLLKETLEKTTVFSDTYRNLKRHMTLARNRSMNSGDLVETLNIIKPALSSQQKVLVDKVIKLFDVIIN